MIRGDAFSCGPSLTSLGDKGGRTGEKQQGENNLNWGQMIN